MGHESSLVLGVRSQVLRQDNGGHNYWQVIMNQRSFVPQETAVIICDMWDKHWSRGAAERVAAIAARANTIIKAARGVGIRIIHSPSDTMGFYAGMPARKRMMEMPRVQPPALSEHWDPPAPLDVSDGGSDTGEKPWYPAWTRQHPGIEIDQERDGISDDGKEIYSLVRQNGITNIIILGVHTNECLLGRPFGIKQMVRLGFDVVLVRDLTDAMYNPAMPPYINHEEGTKLVVGYIEKFWCSTTSSDELLNALRRLSS